MRDQSRAEFPDNRLLNRSWRTINECDADDVSLRVRLDDALRAYHTRVRAISKENGAVLDIRLA